MTSPSPTTSSSAPRPTTTNNTTTTTSGAPAPKLRDSCHACASSKLKCSKEKPSCARCLKRGTQCQYFVTRRGGRRQPGANRANKGQQHNKTSSTGSISQAPTISVTSTSDSATTTEPSTAGPTLTPNDDSIQVFLEKYGATFPNIEAGGSPDHHSDAQRLFTDSPTDLDLVLDDCSALTTPLSFDLSDLTTLNDGPGSHSHNWTLTDSSHSLSIDTAITDPLGDVNSHFNFGGSNSPPCLPDICIPPPSLPTVAATLPDFTFGSMSIDSDNIGVPSSMSDGSCGCHPRALEVLKQLCSAEAASSHMTTQEVINANEHVLETVGKMLPCGCSQDGFLLATLALIAFKVMARYEAAARHSSHRSASPSFMDMTTITDTTMQDAADVDITNEGVSDIAKEQHTVTTHLEQMMILQDGRMSAQVILSELYRVHRFIKGLSKRLKQRAGLDSDRNDPFQMFGYTNHSKSSRNGSGGGGSRDLFMGGSGFGGCGSPEDAALPFSAAFFCQLENDLRRRLRSMSTEIADLVRTA